MLENCAVKQLHNAKVEPVMTQSRYSKNRTARIQTRKKLSFHIQQPIVSSYGNHFWSQGNWTGHLVEGHWCPTNSGLTWAEIGGSEKIAI